MARAPCRFSGDVAFVAALARGRRTISARSTGSLPHEISAHRRESQERPLEVRERLAIPESRLPDACRELTAYPGIEEGMVISTCNRVEVVTHTKNGHADLRGFLHDHFHLKPAELDAHLYEFREKDAVRHLFRVASSLDSMVVGEPQILGQVKEAYATARAVGAVRGQLDQLFSRAFAVAKRVRSETAVGSSSVSIASVAVELAKKIFGTCKARTFSSWARAR